MLSESEKYKLQAEKAKLERLIDEIDKASVLVYSRTVGYYRPVVSWHIGKQQEFKDRKTFKA